MELITQKYKEQVSLMLSCYDRIILSGNLNDLANHHSMTSYLNQHGFRIFDYTHFTEPLRERIRSNMEQMASENFVSIEFVRKSDLSKEDIIGKKLSDRGTHPGIVHILSAMEVCPSYQPWHDKNTGRNFLKPDQGKCLTYYVYFIDEVLGYGFIRVPTWCPFRLQVYLNGHQLLSKELDKAGISYTMTDNAFDWISDPLRAQVIARDMSVENIHARLNELTDRFCPVAKDLDLSYHWSITQVEFATDIVFKRQADLKILYSEMVATAIHTVKPVHIATFLGHKLDPRFEGEAGNLYHVRLEGSTIRHTMGKSSIKMYDKYSKILRIETTANDVSFFKHYREVDHKDGTKTMKMAGVKKTIYSLPVLQDILLASNKRYLEFISSLDNKEVGRKNLEKVTASKTKNNRNYRGINFFSSTDQTLLLSILRGEFNISGLRNKNLQKLLNLNSGQVSRQIKRLLVHCLLKKVRGAYKYYVTRLGKITLIMAEKVKELVLVPAFC